MKITHNLVQSCLLGFLLLAVSTAVQAQFTFITNNGAITITGYTGAGGAVVIPETTNGWPVVNIGNAAFSGKLAITSVTIPNNTTNLGTNAFYLCSGITNVSFGTGLLSIAPGAFFGCQQLPSVTIPDTVLRLGSNVFNLCGGLTNVIIGSAVTNLGLRAFFSCTNLASIVIPAHVAAIGMDAFYGCYSLTNITVAPLNATYSSVDGVLLNKSQNLLVLFPQGITGSYVVPNSVNSIGARAFIGCYRLQQVNFGNSVTNIGDNAFLNCYGLTNIIFGSNLATVGSSTFESCNGLTSIAIPDSVTSIGSYSFSYCSSLAHITIGNGLTSIANFAFAYDSALASVTIPDSITTIYDGAFESCGNLSSVLIGKNVNYIWINAFTYCTQANFYFRGNAPGLGSGPFSMDNGIVYYLPGTTGWSANFGGLTAVLWNALAQVSDGSFDVHTNQFGFNITGTSNLAIVVEASTNLSSWQPLATNTLTGSATYFSDPQWTNYPGRFYRLRSP